MPNNDYISNLLEIKDLIVENIDNTNEEVHIYFKLERRDHVCPFCGALTNKVHDYRPSIIKDSPLLGKATFLHYKKRRYHCSSCNHHFKENFSLLPKHCRITTRLSFFAIHLLRENQNVSAVARQIGISPSSIFRRMADISYPKPSYLPQVLSIDEFRDNISNYFSSFKNRSNVKYFVMDMYPVYRDIAKRYFPNATIVIDKFHVVRYITRALENVRKRVQKDMHPSRRKYFKRSRRILLSHLAQKDLIEDSFFLYKVFVFSCLFTYL